MTQDKDPYDETDTTASEFDEMWKVSEPAETVIQPVRNYVVSLDYGLMPTEPTVAVLTPYSVNGQVKIS